MTWYVVFKGRVPGVYEHWEDAHRQVNGLATSTKGTPLGASPKGIGGGGTVAGWGLRLPRDPTLGRLPRRDGLCTLYVMVL